MFWVITIIAIIVIASLNGAAERQKERDRIEWAKFQESESKIVIHDDYWPIIHDPDDTSELDDDYYPYDDDCYSRGVR